MKTKITLIQFIRSYWNYYIELEEQLVSTKRFVDFDKSNYKTFSIEYLKLLQATCSEIDVVGKIIAEEFDDDFANFKNKNIQKWGYVLHNVFPNIETISVNFMNDYSLFPWNDCEYEKYRNKNNKRCYRLAKGKNTPTWWTAYNKVKHERTSHYQGDQMNYCRANLENLISAMAALFIIETLFIEYLSTKFDDKPFISPSSLFLMEVVH